MKGEEKGERDERRRKETKREEKKIWTPSIEAAWYYRGWPCRSRRRLEFD